MQPKFEFTGETKTVLGHTLQRIRALRSFGNVNKGDFGGWIEKEENLSHDRNAAVEKTHGNNKHAQDYAAAIERAKDWIDLE